MTDKREEFLNFVNRFQPIKSMQFGVEYDRSIISSERLSHYAKEEVSAGMTLVGPHRDDFAIQIRNSKFEIRNLSIYGSRGEQRLAILWLKLAELSYLERETQTLPILLLDDIFSELDMEHRELVFDLIKGHQAIITTTDIGMVDKKWFEEVKLVDLEEK
jgi:DNA replication and repair protein RecF